MDDSLKVVFMGKEFSTHELWVEGLYTQWLLCCQVKAMKEYDRRIEEWLKSHSS